MHFPPASPTGQYFQLAVLFLREEEGEGEAEEEEEQVENSDRIADSWYHYPAVAVCLSHNADYNYQADHE